MLPYTGIYMYSKNKERKYTNLDDKKASDNNIRMHTPKKENAEQVDRHKIVNTHIITRPITYV